MPMGVHAHFMRLHMAWLQVLDDTSFRCSKCDDKGGLEDNDAGSSLELQQSGANADRLLAM